MDRTTDRINPNRANSRGETLVETLVAFAVLLLLLTMVTAAVQGAISISNHAILRTNLLEEAGLTAETGGGTALPEPEAKLTLSFPASSAVAANGRAEIPIAVMRSGTEELFLLYFAPREVTG